MRQDRKGRVTVLVLSRKVGERILIGDQIAVTVVRVAQGGVRLGIEAPAELSVVREELKDRLDAERLKVDRKAINEAHAKPR